MPPPQRITVSLDEKTARLLEKLKTESKLSQSEIFRRALKDYGEKKEGLEVEKGKIETYVDMLAHGEHIILDVDHWQLFLQMVEEEKSEEFWEAHRRVASSHAEQLKTKIKSPLDLIRRLEACNFFKLGYIGSKEITLIFGSEEAKKFIRIFLEEVFSGMDFDVKIKEDLTKIRVEIGD